MFNSIASPLHEQINLPAGEAFIGRMPHPNEMRQALTRVAHRHSPLLQRVWNMAQHDGLSGEDLYTAMAFYLQLEYENMHERLFSFASRALDAPPLYIVKKGGPYDPADTMKR